MKRALKRLMIGGLGILLNCACVSQKSAIRDDKAGDAPESALSLFREGIELLYRDNEKAEEKFSAAIREDAGFIPAYFNQGLARELAGKDAQAKESYERCLARNKKMAACLQNLIIVEAHLSQLSEARALRDAYINEYPEEAFVYVAAAKLAFLENNLAEAERYAQDALLREAENVEALYVMGRVFYAKKQFAAARWVAKNALEREPSHGGFHLLLGHVYIQLELLQDALESYQKAVEAEATEEALESYGLLLRQRGRVKDAVEVLSRLVSLYPSKARHYLHVGNAYMADKQFDNAQRAYLRVVALEPDDKDVYFNLALLFFDSKPEGMNELERLKTSQAYFIRYLESTGLSKDRIAEVARYQKTLEEKIEAEEYAIESAKEQAAQPEESPEEPLEDEQNTPENDPPLEEAPLFEEERNDKPIPNPVPKKEEVAPAIERKKDDEELDEESF